VKCAMGATLEDGKYLMPHNNKTQQQCHITGIRASWKTGEECSAVCAHLDELQNRCGTWPRLLMEGQHPGAGGPGRAWKIYQHQHQRRKQALRPAGGRHDREGHTNACMLLRH
jgi:hypothetical protein